jgi:hypothetical protein
MLVTAAYLIACAIVAVLGVKCLIRMSWRTQHARRFAFVLMTAGGLVPMLVLITHAAELISAADAMQALSAVSAAAQVSGLFFALGLACLLIIGARGQ